MPRPLRDLPSGSLWHVTCHGLDGRPIVRGDDDRRLWVGNAVRAGLADRWEDWPWLGGLHVDAECAVGAGL